MVDNGVDTAGGNYEQPANYPVDTTSDDNLWVVLRRVHFFAGDLITNINLDKAAAQGFANAEEHAVICFFIHQAIIGRV